ncbi:MAG: hypothetical protein KGL39_46415 [Patescibacteria group bacterium]|nr:hypothetical protein [Patescibacteria group bacterium]
MTQREQLICRRALDALHDLDGGQFEEVQLHGDVNVRLENGGRGAASLAEIRAAIALCDARGWINGVAGKPGRMKWSITDRGEAARLEL